MVQAGVPSRMPPGFAAEVSPAMVFLLRVTLVWLQADSTFEPVRLSDRTFQRMMWLSVPSVTSLWPLVLRASARARALALICLLYSRCSGERTSCKAVAIPAIV